MEEASQVVPKTLAIGHETRESLRSLPHWGRDAGMAVLQTRAL